MRILLIASTSLEWQDENGIVAEAFGYVGHHDRNVAEADELAEISGRLDYLSYDRPNPKTATNRTYLANIIAQQHFSVLEHASVTFYVDGVSRNFTHELIRHRHLSFSEVSQRYVDISTFNYISHPTLSKEYGENALSGGMPINESPTGEKYDSIVADLLKKGYTRKEARQAARFYILSACETRILVTGNHRAWRELLPKRLNPYADLEFQNVAKEILKILKKVAPSTYQDIEVPQ